MMSSTRVQIHAKSLDLSNLDKVLYPKAGFTKAHVLDYYRRVSPWLLPHLRLRALTLKRYPDGVESEPFYEKRCPGYMPDWMPIAEIHHTGGKTIRYCSANNLPALMWVANLASLELHVLLSRSVRPEQPTSVVLDLDPGPPADIVDSMRVCLLLRRVLKNIRLDCVAKVSGKKGLHCYIPLNTPVTFDHTKEFAHTLAQRIERHYPDKVTSMMKKSLRGGKVFIDWSQNDSHKTTVCVYSLRAEPTPTVSAPISWEEMERAVDAKDASSLVFGAEKMPERLAEIGDLFEPVLTMRQHLPGARPEEIGAVVTWESNRPEMTKKRKAQNQAPAQLNEYRRKRKFSITPEPSGARGKRQHARRIFVIQKHAARRLHYDLRLEFEGVLKSWAVPKGPSLDPKEKRLAVEVEDHPLDYADFEGRIPEKQYGAGAVIVWDHGTYTVKGSEKEALAKGHLEFFLEGIKLHGAFDLIRTRQDAGGKMNWLLIKRKDEMAQSEVDPLVAEPYSVLSGLTIADLEEAGENEEERNGAPEGDAPSEV